MIIEKVEKLKSKLNDSCDLVVKEVACGEKEINIIFFQSVIEENYFINGILSPITNYNLSLKENKLSEQITLDILFKSLRTMDIKKIEEKDALKEISLYKLLIFIEGEEGALSIDIIDYPARMPSEPATSAVMKGPREGFVEDYKNNIAMLRRRFSADKLTVEQMKLGKYSQTAIAFVYVKEIVDLEMVKKVKGLLEKIDIDGIIDSYYLISFLQGKKGSIFKQIGNYEKPDIVSSKILEGRLAIIVNNSPIVLTLPFILLEDIQNSNDYYSQNYYVTYIRVIRIIGIFIAILLPGFYVTLRLYHYNVMPINFLMTIGNSSESIPFTPFVEILFILILFEILYEVSLRLPRYFGLATSIVGALILGETGVKAGLISSPAVMIIALSFIATYTIPDQVNQITLLRVTFLILGACLGIFGLIGAAVFVVAYMNTINNFGSAYLAPFAPFVKEDLKDSLLKLQTTKMDTRPKSIVNKNKVRLKYGKNNKS